MPRLSNTPIHDIHDIIHAYILGRGGDSSDILLRLDKAIREYEQQQRFTAAALGTQEGAELLQAIFIDLIRSWQSREKGKVAQALVKFSAHLRAEYGISLDEEALPRDIPDITQRRLDMLKFLQTPRTMRELELRYLTSERTLRNDLTILVNGWDIMGSRIQINRIDSGGTIAYNSTAHPILLPLNLTEVYALAIGVPALAKGTVYEEITRYLADAVTMQLSGYAVNILAKSALDTPLGRMLEDGLSYRREEPMLAESRNAWLIYLTKQGRKCRVTYVGENGEVHRIEGIPSLAHGDFHSIGFRDTETLVPLTAIVSFEPMVPYQ